MDKDIENANPTKKRKSADAVVSTSSFAEPSSLPHSRRTSFSNSLTSMSTIAENTPLRRPSRVEILDSRTVKNRQLPFAPLQRMPLSSLMFQDKAAGTQTDIPLRQLRGGETLNAVV